MGRLVVEVNGWADVWWPYVLHSSWQAAVVALLALCLVRFGRRWSSPLRYGLLAVALVKFALPPLAALPTGLFSRLGPMVWDNTSISSLRQSVAQSEQAPLEDDQNGAFTPQLPVPAPAAFDQHESSRGADGGPPGAGDASPTGQSGVPAKISRNVDGRAAPDSLAPSAAPSRVSKSGAVLGLQFEVRPLPTLRAWLMLLHLTGSSALAVWLAKQGSQLQRVLRQGERVTQGTLSGEFVSLCRQLRLVHTPRLLLVSGDSTPYSCGVLRPVVVLPRDLAQRLTALELRATLAHELAHHSRGDLWVNTLQAALCVAWWFHPLVWLVNRALRAAREDCCDDLVLARAWASDKAYCGVLLEVAASRRATPRLALRMSAGPEQLARRFCRIMDPTLDRPGRLPARGWLLVLLSSCLLLPGLRSKGAAQPPPADNTRAATEDAATEETATAARPDDSEVAGTVVDANVRPVPDAQVWFTEDPAPGRSGLGLEHVLASGTTDERGRFRLEAPAADPASTYHALWLYKPNYQLVFQSFGHYLPSQGVELTLAAGATESFQVLDPDGSPLAGTSVRVKRLKNGKKGRRQLSDVPEELKPRLAAVSDENGRWQIAGIQRDNLAMVSLESKEYGTQELSFDEDDASTSLNLRPAGRLAGRIVCDDARAAVGLKLRVFTQPLGATPGVASNRYGLAEVVADDQGRFEVQAIAEGTLHVISQEPDDLAFRIVRPDGLVVNAGDTTEIQLRLQRAVSVTGTVRDQASGQPVVGAKLSLQTFPSPKARTDEQGQFQFYHLSGNLSLRFEPPPPYLTPAWGVANIPAGAREHELPAIELVRGREFIGNLDYNEAEPFVEVHVTATWDNPRSNGTLVWAYCDRAGRFVFPAVHAERDLTLRGYHKGLPICAPIIVKSGEPQPYALRVHAPEMARLSGRVVDRQSQPLPSVEIQITSWNMDSPGTIGFAVVDRILADADGRFTTKKLVRQGNYRAAAMSGESKLAETELLAPSKDGTTEFPELAIAAKPKSSPVAPPGPPRPVVKSLRARVVDGAGRPVSKALIIAWFEGHRVRMPADDRGRFRIADVTDLGGFVFVSAAGCRFHGEYIRPAEGEVLLVVARTSEPSLPSLSTLPSLPSATESANLVRTWFDANTRRELRVGQDNVDIDDMQAAELMAKVDPLRSIEFFAEHPSPSGWWNERQKYLAARRLLKSDLAEGLAVVNSLDDASFRLLGYREAADSLPPSARDRKLDLLRETLAQARKIDAPESRMLYLGQVAERLLNLGALDEANRLLGEGRQIAEQLPNEGRPGSARRAFAEYLALVDLEASLKWAAGATEDFEFDLLHGQIAHKLASTQPADAERVWKMLHDERSRDQSAARVCHRMAPVDLARTRGIAAAVVGTQERAYALGMTAEALAAVNPRAAAWLVKEAFSLLTELVDQGDQIPNSPRRSYSVAVALLPIVEQIDPALVREYLWRALSLRLNVTTGRMTMALGRHGERGWMHLSDPVLAACLTRYDRDLARLVLEPSGDEAIREGTYPDFYFAALAMLDAPAAARLAEALPKSTRDQTTRKHRAQNEIIAALVARDEGRWQWLTERQLFLWVADHRP